MEKKIDAASVAIVPVAVSDLVHIEGFSRKRVAWLIEKIKREGVWNKPLALDDAHHLVLDGQHRMEAAKALGLAWVPAIKFPYRDVEVWSLRKNHEFDWQLVTQRAIDRQPYPFKTVKHGFPVAAFPTCQFSLKELYEWPL